MVYPVPPAPVAHYVDVSFLFVHPAPAFVGGANPPCLPLCCLHIQTLLLSPLASAPVGVCVVSCSSRRACICAAGVPLDKPRHSIRSARSSPLTAKANTTTTTRALFKGFPRRLTQGPQLRFHLAFLGRRSFQLNAAPLTCLRALLQVPFGRFSASAYVRVLSEPRPAFSPLTHSLASLR